jgi:transcriptional/translational regulatory protein YebC/TACO1
LIESKINVESSEVSFLPKNTVKLEGEAAKKCLAFIDALDEHEDVKNVYANFDIDQETLDEVSK